MAGERVLIVEDDPTMLRGLKDNFTHEGYEVRTAADGAAGLESALDWSPELIILDVMLPEMNGYEICRLIRDEDIEVPIIMLTAKTQESDIILGLNIGADDYVTKPFSISELLARANGMLRRGRTHKSKTIRFGEFELNLDRHRLTKNGTEVVITPKEFGVLAYLLELQGRTATRDQILQSVWGYNVFVTGRSIDRCVTTLRKKIEINPHKPSHIVTVRSIGYKFQT
jgi:DNA-binding response OmpR family regulator